MAISLNPQTLPSNTAGQKTQLTLTAYDPSGETITATHNESFVDANGKPLTLTLTSTKNVFSFSPASFTAPNASGALTSTATLTSPLKSAMFPLIGAKVMTSSNPEAGQSGAIDHSAGDGVTVLSQQIGVPITDPAGSAYANVALQGNLVLATNPSTGNQNVYGASCYLSTQNSQQCEIIDFTTGAQEQLTAPPGGNTPDLDQIDTTAPVLTTGGDGNLWFFDLENQAVGYVSPGLVANATPTYPEPLMTFGTQPGSGNEDCCQTGPDGAIWFLNNAGNPQELVRVSESGVQMTPFTADDVSVATVGPPSTAWIATTNIGGPDTTSIGTMPLSGGPVSTVATYPAPLGGMNSEILDAAVSADGTFYLVIDPCTGGCFDDPVEVYSVTPNGTTTLACPSVQSTPTSPLVPLTDGSLVYGGYYGNYNDGAPGTFTRIVPDAGCITEQAYAHANGPGSAAIAAGPNGSVFLITPGGIGSGPPQSIHHITSIGV